MSLINQLLKDLEGRHAAGAEIKGIAPQARSLPEKRLNPAKLAGIGLLIIAVALGGYGLFRWQANRPQTLQQPASAIAVRDPGAINQQASIDLPAQAPQAVEDALLAPVFQLSEELSFVPAERPAQEPAPRPKPAKAKPNQVKAEPKSSPKPAPASKPVDTGAAAAPAAPSASADAAPSPAPAASSAPRSPQKARTPEAVEEVMIAADLPPAPIEKQTKALTAYERAETLFRDGVDRLRQGRLSDAEARFRAAMREDRSHVSAQQALIGLLIDSQRNDDAEQVLREALAVNPRQPRYAMLLARLELDRGDAAAAVTTLESAKPYAGTDAEFYAFHAAALQRAGRNAEAAGLYRSALAITPGNAVWLMGFGISLRASNQLAEAKEAFRRAAESRTLSAELQQFVEGQYQELGTTQR